MSTSHLLIIFIPSFLAGLIFGRSLSSAALWGLAAEVIGLILAVLPISAGGPPRPGLSLSTAAVSIVLGATAGALGFASLRLLQRKK
jgi:hypothetical protein